MKTLSTIAGTCWDRLLGLSIRPADSAERSHEDPRGICSSRVLVVTSDEVEAAALEISLARRGIAAVAAPDPFRGLAR